MEQVLKLENTCRSCLNENEKLENLYNEKPLADLFINITALQLDAADNTYNICDACWNTLESIQEFIDICKKNYEFLLQHKKIAMNLNIITDNTNNLKTNAIYPKECDEVELKPNTRQKWKGNNPDVSKVNQPNCIVVESSDESTNYLINNENQNSDDDVELNEQSENSSDHVDAAAFIQIKRRHTQFPHTEVLHAVEVIDKEMKQEGKCIKCAFVSSDNRYLPRHMKHLHEDIINRWCKWCNLEVDNLKEHSEIHTNHIQCVFCKKVFKKKSQLIEHLFCHSDQPSHKCTICKEIFTTKTSLMQHIHEQKEVEIKGEDCKRLKTEKNTSTKPPDPALCSVCGKQFKTKSKLTIHMRMHIGYAGYKCSYCDKTALTRSHLVLHERTHTGEKPHICHVCGKSFAQSSVLKTHLRRHTGRPEACMLCSKRFCRPAELKLHMRRHTGEKPFSCTECGQSFIQKSHLVDHEKTHRDEKPFICGVCSRGFRQKSCLKSHINIHTGEKPFKCTQCPYACRQSYSLTQHMKQHSNNRIR